MSIIRAVDVSEFTREISPEWWRMVRDQHSVKAAVIQAWGGGPNRGRQNDYFLQQLNGAIAAGLHVAAYCWPPRDWQQAIGWINGSRQHIAFFALDIEAGAGVTREMVDGVRAAGYRPVIYTNPNDWNGIMHGTIGFSDEALWLARYHWRAPTGQLYAVRWDVGIDKAFGTAQAVGGWKRDTKKIAGWQFTGTAQLGAETVDLNLFYESAFDLPEGDDIPMTPAERAQLEELMARKRWVDIFLKYHGEQIDGILEAIDNLAPGDDLAVLRAKVAANAESIEDFGARLRDAAGALGGGR